MGVILACVPPARTSRISRTSHTSATRRDATLALYAVLYTRRCRRCFQIALQHTGGIPLDRNAQALRFGLLAQR